MEKNKRKVQKGKQPVLLILTPGKSEAELLSSKIKSFNYSCQKEKRIITLWNKTKHSGENYSHISIIPGWVIHTETHLQLSLDLCWLASIPQCFHLTSHRSSQRCDQEIFPCGFCILKTWKGNNSFLCISYSVIKLGGDSLPWTMETELQFKRGKTKVVSVGQQAWLKKAKVN